MRIVHTIGELRAALAGADRTALVPTMGNLHAGHLALVQEAARRGSPVVASIFVNRLQFLPHEDFERYPRTLENDAKLLAGAGCDLVFAPDERELYPEPQAYKVMPPPALADILEGEFRPGFFSGVATVVMKLFECVRPAYAVFGKKDYQQLLVVTGMVRQFAMPLEIVGFETVRDGDGLALSSRNGYLSADEKSEAVALSRALAELAACAHDVSKPLVALESAAMARLRARGWAPDYMTLRRRSDLLPPNDRERAARAPMVALGAAKIGATRLIDNLEC